APATPTISAASPGSAPRSWPSTATPSWKCCAPSSLLAASPLDLCAGAVQPGVALAVVEAERLGGEQAAAHDPGAGDADRGADGLADVLARRQHREGELVLGGVLAGLLGIVVDV